MNTTTNGKAGRAQPRRGAPATQGAAAAPKPTTPPRSASSTPSRPKVGGKCAAVWDYLDAHPTTAAKELREIARSKGLNVNNAICELYAWRRSKGINGRQKHGKQSLLSLHYVRHTLARKGGIFLPSMAHASKR